MLEWLSKSTETAIVNGIDSEWTLANNKNNELSRRVFGDNIGRLTQEQYRRYFSTNDDARQAFIQRKENGLNLSDRVWKYTDEFKQDIEWGLDLGLRYGLSADEISRELRKYLQHPDMLFRGVRDEHGDLVLSKHAKNFHPGRGVYRSSYMNARRLAATETNIAYRTADYERYKQLDFVVGIEIKLSNNHNCKGVTIGKYYDICDELAGKYPKEFKFTGWHPHCRCHVITILKTEVELMAENEAIMRGEEPTNESVNRVEYVPQAFKDWIEKNQLSIDKTRKNGTLPYFIRDNENMKWFNSAQVSRFTEDYVGNFYKVGLYIISKEHVVECMRNSPFNRLDVMELDKDIRTIMKKNGFDELITGTMKANNGYISLNWSDYRNKFNLTRKFFVDTQGRKVVDHHLFELPRNLQGKGISKKIFNALYNQYRIVGVQRMEVFANIDVGGYTWARYGFCVEKRECAISAVQFSKLTNKQKQRIVALIDKHFNDSPDKPFPMNTIARLPYGREALLGGYWNGMLDLTDPVQRKRFEHYLRR